MTIEAFRMRNDSDRAAVLRLWHDNMSDSRIRPAIDARWKWLSERNPAGPIRVCVVVETATGAVVGAAGALPRKLWIRGREISAAVLCDFVIDKAHRTAGPAVVLQRTMAKTCFEDGIEVLYGFPNQGASPVLTRVGYKTIGMASMWFRPLRASHKIREYVVEPLAWGAGIVVDTALRTYELLLHLRRKRGYIDSLRDRPDASFQELWERGRGLHPISGERTPGYLSWRYSQHPIEQCGFFCLNEATRGQLRAYIAYVLLAGKVNVLDVFWDSREVLQPLFLGFVRRMRALGHVSISVCHLGDIDVIRPLRQLGFVQSKHHRRFVCKVDEDKNGQLAEAVHDPFQWSLFDGELDI